MRSQGVKAELQSTRLKLAAREAADAAHTKAMTEDYDQTMRHHEALKRKASEGQPSPFAGGMRRHHNFTAARVSERNRFTEGG